MSYTGESGTRMEEERWMISIAAALSELCPAP